VSFLDHLRLAFGALLAHKLRTGLSMLGVAIGVAAVILLTSIGEGTRKYVVSEFTQFGTNVIAINPGKVETVGLPGVFGGTTRKLTIDDAEALRRVNGVDDLVAFVAGFARIEAGGLGRSVNLFGVTSHVPQVWRMGVRQGRFLPEGDPRRGAPVCVLGPRLKRELFGERNALGEWVRAGDIRLRVIGIMEPKGQLLGFDMDDTIYVPLATGMALFNREEVWEIDLTYAHESQTEQVAADVRRLLIDRHGGREDFTLTTQAQMLAVFGKIMTVVTAAVGGIAGISLVVGAIGILTTMWIAVGERTHEIGLIRALGASAGQVHRLFLIEAAALAGTGGAFGLAAGLGLAALLKAFLPGLPVHTPAIFVAAALAVSTVTGLISGAAPARRAAALDPVEALRAE
jgi:putative ABC transport system permease protein